MRQHEWWLGVVMFAGAMGLGGCGGGGGDSDTAEGGPTEPPPPPGPPAGEIVTLDTPGQPGPLFHTLRANAVGEVVSVWQAPTGPDLLDTAIGATLLTNQGWQPAIRLAPARAASDIRVAFNDRGDLFVVWNPLAGGIEANTIVDGSVGAVLPLATTTAGAPRVAADPADEPRALAVWRDLSEGGLATSRYERATGWGMPQPLPLASADEPPGIPLAVSALVAVHSDVRGRQVLWRTADELRLSRWLSGSGWQAATVIPRGPLPASPFAAFNRAGDILLAGFVVAGGTSQLFALRSTGGRWAAPVLVDARAGIALGGGPQESIGGVQLALDAAGNGAALWQIVDTRSQVLAARLHDDQWSEVMVLASDARMPALAANAAGALVAVWLAGERLLAARYSDAEGRWLEARELAQVGFDAIEPAAVLTPEGRLVVVWTDPDGLHVLSAALSP